MSTQAALAYAAPMGAPSVGQSIFDHAVLRNFDGKMSGPMGLLLDRALDLVAEAEQMMADQRARIDYLESIALTDELTRLVNRRGFNESLARELATAKRHGGVSGVLVLIDLDGFKEVNDTLGHLAGDAVLRKVAKILQANTRSTDIVARLGGDEFAVILAHTDEAAAQTRIDALDRQLNHGLCGWQDHMIPVGGSVGAAPFDRNSTAEAVFQAADAKLYAMKANRRYATKQRTN
jgi:diguanylate cyclase (GGDEF)-like protein